ncbi:MAG: hydroxyacylglutathione hydrolase [Legionellaceae bacterium]
MNVRALPAFQDNYIWILSNAKQKTFCCVDPGDATPVLSYAKHHQQKLTTLLLTHHHADHTGGVRELRDQFPDVLIYGPEDTNTQDIHVDHHTFKILLTPGHTKTHRCYYEPHEHLLFCGDTLFSGGCGRVFDGTLEDLYHSLGVLASLPDETKVYCAHEYTRSNLAFAATVEPDNQAIRQAIDELNLTPNSCSLPSTILREKQINPFLHTQGPHLFAFAQSRGLDPSDSFGLFKQLREEKNKF